MALPVEDHGDRVAVYAPHGDLEVSTVGAARAELTALEKQPAVIIDLTAVNFIDSAGLGVIIGALRRVREGDGRAAICGPRAPIRRLLHVTGVDRQVPIVDTFDDAVLVLTSDLPG